jgi:hypothetical protein
MDDFKRAQALFSQFQKTFYWPTLEEALNILDELIEEGFSQAQNLEKTINRFMVNEKNKIMEKYNIKDFDIPHYDRLILLIDSTNDQDFAKLKGILQYFLRDK